MSRDLVLTRRALGAAALALPCVARAASWPEQDIKFIVPYGAGGGFDLYVRAVAPAMQARLPNKVQVVPTNVPAGGGVMGVGQLYRARPDGYTIGILNIPGMFILQESGGAAYDLQKLSYVGSMGRDEYGIGVAANSPLRSIDDLRKLSQQRPVKFTSTGREGTAYAATLIAAKLLGLRTQMITGYKGSDDYVVAAIRGDGDAVVCTLPILQRMQDGKLLRVLATFQKTSSFPGAADATSLGVPELSDIILERLVAAPPRLPAAIQATLAGALDGALADPRVQAWAKSAGANLQVRTPAEAKRIVDDQAAFYAKWKSVVAAS